jgi:hypothetical protein
MNHDQASDDRTSSEVSVYAHVSGSSTQALAFTIRDVLLCLWITVLLGHPEIHDVYHLQPVSDSRTQRKETRTIGSLGPWSTHEEVIRFDVTVDQILLVDCLHTRDLPLFVRGAV